jgi:hypothetical protein
MVHSCNPSTQGAGQEDFETEARLGYIMRPYLKTKEREQAGVVA